MNGLNWRAYAAEVLGTFALVFLGTMAAVLGGTVGILGIALVFGLTVTAMAFAVGGISGGHFNPAVSLAMAIRGKLSWKDFVLYLVSQVVGALLASLVLMAITSQALVSESFGANDIAPAFAGGDLPWLAPLLVEILITFVFLFVIFTVTAKKENSKIAPFVIGLTLTILIVVGFNVTGSSLNPARSLAPALFQGGTALENVWIFIVGPLVGAALAAFVQPLLVKSDANE